MCKGMHGQTNVMFMKQNTRTDASLRSFAKYFRNLNSMLQAHPETRAEKRRFHYCRIYAIIGFITHSTYQHSTFTNVFGSQLGAT